MSSRVQPKAGAKEKRSKTFEKEPWYAVAAERISAARTQLGKDSPSLSPAEGKRAREDQPLDAFGMARRIGDRNHTAVRMPQELQALEAEMLPELLRTMQER